MRSTRSCVTVRQKTTLKPGCAAPGCTLVRTLQLNFYPFLQSIEGGLPALELPHTEDGEPFRSCTGSPYSRGGVWKAAFSDAVLEATCH